MSLVIWNPDHVWELYLANMIGFDLFDGIEVIDGQPSYELKNDTRKKVVIKNWWLWAGTNEPPEDLSWADLIICYTSEVINGPWDRYYKKTLERFNNENFICVSNGRFRLTDFPADRVYDDLGHFFSRIVSLCPHDTWNLTDHKPKLFDALLGIAKPHRIFIFNKLKSSGLLDQSFVNIHGSVNYCSPDLLEFDDPAITDKDRQKSMQNLDGLDNGLSVSHSVPLKIYQNSWYSIVAETDDSRSNFLTEKTAKPLYEKKLFVLFGSQGLLKKLHQQGYKTFDGVIDESYDQEPNDITRWNMAFNQIKKLSSANHLEIYRQINDVLEHNYMHICDHNYRLNGLKNFLTQHISKL